MKDYRPHAILLNIIIPGVEDSDMCRQIKATDEISDIPLIVLSTGTTVKATIKDLCADEVVSKPFEKSSNFKKIGLFYQPGKIIKIKRFW